MGSALKDIMFHSDQLFIVKNPQKDSPDLLAMEYGQKISIKQVFVNYGGGALNVAMSLKNFGIHVAPLVRLGCDTAGQEIYQYLKKHSLPTFLINVDKEQRTGFSVIISALRHKEHTIFTYKGASSNLQLPGLRTFRTQWFYVSSLTNADWPLIIEKLCHQTKRNVKIAWNPGVIQLGRPKVLARFLKNIELLILNKEEAQSLVKQLAGRTTAEQLSNPKFLLSFLKELGAVQVIITQGDKGAVGLDDVDYYYHPAQSVKTRIVDTVGAGDAFSAGLLAALVRGKSLDQAMGWGIKNSASVLYKLGAQRGLLKAKL